MGDLQSEPSSKKVVICGEECAQSRCLITTVKNVPSRCVRQQSYSSPWTSLSAIAGWHWNSPIWAFLWPAEPFRMQFLCSQVSSNTATRYTNNRNPTEPKAVLRIPALRRLSHGSSLVLTAPSTSITLHTSAMCCCSWGPTGAVGRHHQRQRFRVSVKACCWIARSNL